MVLATMLLGQVAETPNNVFLTAVLLVTVPLGDGNSLTSIEGGDVTD